ncbi:hypothetical protein L3Q82_004090 [Scortum barcoo]|uniref:Uncharacterized protein n=1 Tax=Scortum barcoo TaxID=214431 RepID=A0ACB8X7W2_9TELE|nr:hypothetical protein L3Q82_004090 [Scortum barcoo]
MDGRTRLVNMCGVVSESALSRGGRGGSYTHTPFPLRTEMAAAALSRRGVTGVRTTKGLFFIVTLLSLVCVARTWIDKDQLVKLKEDVQRAQQQMDSLKAEYKSTSVFMSKYMILMDPLMALLKKASPDFPPLEEFLENIKGFMEKTKTFIDGETDETDARIEEMEEKLGKFKKLIKFLEEQQAEF